MRERGRGEKDEEKKKGERAGGRESSTGENRKTAKERKEAEMRVRKKKKKRRRRKHTQGRPGGVEEVVEDKPEVEIEYIQEDVLQPTDVHYRQFHKIFEAFRLTEKETPPTATPTARPIEQTPMTIAAKSAAAQKKQREEEEEEEEEEPTEPSKMSKKKLRKLNRLTVAQLKQLVDRPDVVEMYDVTAHDPRLLIHLKCQ